MYPKRWINRSSSVGCQRLRILCKHLRMSSTSAEMDTEVLLEIKNKVGMITLNRPKALNALNLNMIRQIYPVLKKWDVDPAVGLVVIKGAGDRAFCAGGDVRAVADAGKKGDELTKIFFKEEYMLNYAIGKLHFNVIHVLLGERLKGYDVKHAGVATHFVTSEKLSDLESSLLNLSDPQLNDVQNVLDDYDKKCSEGQKEFVLEKFTHKIDSCFDKPTLEEILQALKEDGSDWALKQIEVLNKMSPISLKITLRQLQEGANLSLGECLKMEYRLTQRCMADNDFYEGIRAVLVDKDNSPKWQPSTLDAVSKGKVDSYFETLGDRELVL
ncbi:3-hydroxyisobutyryl-CoA hydrolase, mitochondrial-like [Orbicella faveolata]|uniref:3-hydroxyisobutyryl-CoA hydrolase, mitochondrial-like n=1 Tax=Orbicella faveolata TaxID=48498 RepID=UPI0009E565E2|nr:3-hydroxyisobutyryl-CoA hydrolase, mitochondrial-like [Orbicella faveolata]